MTGRPTHAVLSTVTDASDLIDAARELAKTADAHGMPETAKQVRAIARDLDGWRTRLLEDGEADIAGALTSIEAATEYLPAHAVHIGRGVRR
ncbi:MULTISPECIES: hypothetical protein [unclassified Microbacterium]|uniref:hypothetical protein n=1 Tax=unclassified Microbacterium TaxID=2609290 RepID=UPI003015E13C